MAQVKPVEKSTQATEKKGPEFAIQRLYLKDLSLETPNTPKIFLEKWVMPSFIF